MFVVNFFQIVNLILGNFKKSYLKMVVGIYYCGNRGDGARRNLHTLRSSSYTDSLLSVEIVHFLLLVFYKYSSNYAQKGSQHLLRLNLSPSLSSRKLNSPAFFPCGVPHIVVILCSIPILVVLYCCSACSRTEFPPAVR